MSKVVSVVNQITNQTLQHAPAVIAGIQAAEVSGASGANKKQAVLNGILAGAKVEEASTIPAVASISAMIDMFVTIFNSLGIFSHSPASPVSQSFASSQGQTQSQGTRETPIPDLTKLNPNIK